MSPRLFLSLYIVLISFVIYNYADEAVTGSKAEDALSGASAAVRAVGKIIGTLFVDRAASCLIEAAVECKDYWKKPSGALDCARQYLARNNGRCLKS